MVRWKENLDTQKLSSIPFQKKFSILRIVILIVNPEEFWNVSYSCKLHIVLDLIFGKNMQLFNLWEVF